MRFFTRFFVPLVFLLGFYTGFGQAFSLSDKAQISLITCGSGNELYSTYGHTALRVFDPNRSLDAVYNYGTFDFSAPNFYGRFIKGDLEYFVSVSTFAEFNYAYVYDDREIVEQILNLSPQQKQQIFDELSQVMSSEKRYYTYKFIDRNCTTMVADLINNVLKEKIATNIPDTQKSYRNILYGYLHHNFYTNLGINLMFGLKTDKQSDKLFLPTELMEGVSKTKNGTSNLVKEQKTIYKKQNYDQPKSLWNNYFTFLAFVGVLALLAKKRKFQLTWLVICGLLGLFFSVVGLYSLHEEVLWNYNILLMNPAFLVLAFFMVRENDVWIKRSILFCVACLLLYTAFIALKAQFVMMLPLILLNGLYLWNIWKASVVK